MSTIGSKSTKFYTNSHTAPTDCPNNAAYCSVITNKSKLATEKTFHIDYSASF